MVQEWSIICPAVFGTSSNGSCIFRNLRRGQTCRYSKHSKDCSSTINARSTASFDKIVVSDDQPLVLDIDTFKRLDSATQTADWSPHRGTSILESSNLINEESVVPNDIQIIASSFAELQEAGLIGSSGLVEKLDVSSDSNLISQINKITLGSFSTDDLPSLINIDNAGIALDIAFAGGNITSNEFKQLVELDATFPANTFLVDTPAEIKDILLSTDPGIVSGRNFIQGISSINSPAAIELTWQQYVQVTSSSDENLPVSNILSNVGNIEFVVSGTASELENLFQTFGSDFSGLGIGISFRVTDGNEVKLNASQIDVLDGRLTGAAIVEDTSDGISTMLESSIASQVKDIQVKSDTQLTLNVSQFRNLPGYASDSVIIQDTEINIIRALSYGTLDDRVTTLSITSEKIEDNGLTLNVSTANKIGDYEIVDTDGQPLDLIIRDRSSVIADFIETGSLSDNYLKISSSSSESDDAPFSALPISSVKFNATDKDTIELNSQQNEAFESFRHDYNFDVDGSTPFEEEDALLDNIEEYVDKRLDDLSKAIDSTNPLKKLDDYRDDHEKWTENKQSASDSAWSDKQQDVLMKPQVLLLLQLQRLWFNTKIKSFLLQASRHKLMHGLHV